MRVLQPIMNVLVIKALEKLQHGVKVLIREVKRRILKH